MGDAFLRTKLLVGESKFERLSKSKVAVFGVGGVGSFAVEALVRAGIGSLDIFDADRIDVTNINRQLIANVNNIGAKKVEAVRERILSINPNAVVNSNYVKVDASNIDNYDFDSYDYVVDAIDMVSSKLLIIEKAKKLGKKIISSMGTGNKIDPSKLQLDDIYNTSVCPLARVMRKELKARGIESLRVVYSKEKPLYIPKDKINASISFVPSVAGLLMASEVVRDLTEI